MPRALRIVLAVLVLCLGAAGSLRVGYWKSLATGFGVIAGMPTAETPAWAKESERGHEGGDWHAQEASGSAGAGTPDPASFHHGTTGFQASQLVNAGEYAVFLAAVAILTRGADYALRSRKRRRT